MKAIKLLPLFLVLLFILGCNDDEGVKNYDTEFIRFGMLVNANGELLEYPAVRPGLTETDTYKHFSTKTIKIPVVLSGNVRETATDVFYEVSSEGNYSDFETFPDQKVSIPAGKLIDTLEIRFNSRWQEADVNKIHLKITSTSDQNITIGWPNNHKKLDEITITLGGLSDIQYSFNTNLYAINGNLNEELIIPVRFSQAITHTMIGDFNFITANFVALSSCDGEGGTFDYSLEQLPFDDGATQVLYKFKVLETTPFASNIILTLQEGLNDFVRSGTVSANVAKQENSVRTGDVAANWYNLSDAFYRTYGKAWYYDPATGNCRWSNFNTFTKPVSVAPGSEFDNGQGFHKYRIGFVGNNPPVGTNPFDFKKYYDQAGASSPGFTIVNALEFFPDNGNSTTSGIVKVVPQTITFIKLSNNQPVSISICGNGNYFYNATASRWEMYIEIHCDETQINGNNDVVRPMYIYSNNNNYVNPTDLNVPCPQRISL